MADAVLRCDNSTNGYFVCADAGSEHFRFLSFDSFPQPRSTAQHPRSQVNLTCGLSTQIHFKPQCDACDFLWFTRVRKAHEPYLVVGLVVQLVIAGRLK